MSYGVGTCILPMVRRAIAGTMLLGGSYIAYDIGVKPTIKSMMLKFNGPAPKPVKPKVEEKTETSEEN